MKFSNKVVLYSVLLGYQNNLSLVVDKWLWSLYIGILGSIICVVIAEKSLRHLLYNSFSECLWHTEN